MSTKAVAGPTTRERIVVAAAQIVADEDWASLTMGRLAAAAGVSRQTVYNEFGSKPRLAEAVILNEMLRFLEVMEAAFARHPDDLVKAVERTVRDVLELAAENVLVQGVVTASQGSVTGDFLPYLTTQSDNLVTSSRAAMRDLIDSYPHGLTGEELDTAIDLMVRVIISHMMNPDAQPRKTARSLGWVAGRLFRTPES